MVCKRSSHFLIWAGGTCTRCNYSAACTAQAARRISFGILSIRSGRAIWQKAVLTVRLPITVPHAGSPPSIHVLYPCGSVVGPSFACKLNVRHCKIPDDAEVAVEVRVENRNSDTEACHASAVACGAHTPCFCTCILGARRWTASSFTPRHSTWWSSTSSTLFQVS